MIEVEPALLRLPTEYSILLESAVRQYRILLLETFTNSSQLCLCIIVLRRTGKSRPRNPHKNPQWKLMYVGPDGLTWAGPGKASGPALTQLVAKTWRKRRRKVKKVAVFRWFVVLMFWLEKSKEKFSSVFIVPRAPVYRVIFNLKQNFRNFASYLYVFMYRP